MVMVGKEERKRKGKEGIDRAVHYIGLKKSILYISMKNIHPNSSIYRIGASYLFVLLRVVRRPKA